jgi:protoporphyrinogen oxidase
MAESDFSRDCSGTPREAERRSPALKRPEPEHPVLIIGAGPAGLTAAYELARHGVPVHVLEQSSQVGGISRTEVRDGYRFDIGGHRFFSKNQEVNALWREVLGEEFMRVPRISRIFYGGKFYDYPLSAFDALQKLGPIESFRILLSYLSAKVHPLPVEKTFEQWVVNRFGRRLFETFFKTYTEKVWGIPCKRISAEWAAQRIKGLSLRAAITNAVFGSGDAKSLIKEFNYPRLGPGQMWERFRDAVRTLRGTVTVDAEVVAIHHDGNGRVTAVTVEESGKTNRLDASHLISSMPLTLLLTRLDPLPHATVLAAAQMLGYRDFLIVGLVVRREKLFPDNWIYIHTPGVRVGRIQNFKNWSICMLPDPSKTSLGMEYFCTRGDETWNMPDDELIALAKRELTALGLANGSEVEGGVVIRQPMAYPVYDDTYREHLETIKTYLATFKNLQTVGRNGMHRYNNQDHSMLTGLLAARNVMGDSHDLWAVNADAEYHEEHSKSGSSPDNRPSVALEPRHA